MFVAQLTHAAELIKAAQLNSAQALLQTLYRETETQCGTQSETHLQTILLIGIWHIATGEYEAAKSLLQTLAADENHAAAQVALAQLYRECGQYEQAHDILQNCLFKLPENPNTTNQILAWARNELGCVLLGLSQVDEALVQFERAAAEWQQYCGMYDMHTVRAFRYVATVYRIQGHDNEALSVLNSLLPISESLYPHKHPETAEILAELAQIHDEQGDFNTADDLYQRAHAIFSATLGEQHPLFARLLCRYAIHFLQQQQPETALPLLQQAAAIYVQVFDGEHSAVQNLLRFIVLMQLTADGIFPDVDTVIQ